jgi:hypothetical protein
MENNQLVEPTAVSSVWRYARASRAHVVIDAAAYFELMYDAMLHARQRIFLIGWDFDSRIRLAGGRRWWNLPRKDRCPARLGSYFLWLARRTPGLQIRMLKWNFGALKYLFRGSMIIDRFQIRFRASAGLQPSSKDCCYRRLLCCVRRHRYDLGSLGYARTSR